MASAQPMFSQQVLAVGTQFLGDLKGRTAVCLTQKSSFRLLWSCNKMIITPAINHFPWPEAPLCSLTEKPEYALRQNHPASLQMLLLLISAKLADFILTPRWALTGWSHTPEVEHKPPEENEHEQLGWDMGSKRWHFKLVHKPLQYGHKIR